MAVKAYLFDMDGTLINSMPALTDLAVEIICKHYPITPEEAKESYLNTVGIAFGKQIESIFGHENIAAEEEYLNAKVQCTIEAPPIEQTYYKAIDAWNLGLISGVVSSTEHELVHTVIHKTFPDNKFNWISGIGFSNIEHTKRHQIRAFLNSYPIMPAQVNYFGDSKEDFEIAELFGMKFTKVHNGSLV